MPGPVERTISTLALRGAVGFASEAGVDVGALLRRCGLQPAALLDHSAQIPATVGSEILAEAARLSGDPHFGLHLALREPVGAYDVVDYATRSSATLGEVLHKWVRFQRLLSDAWQLTLDVAGPTCTVTREPLVPKADLATMNEYVAALMTVRCRQFTGRKWSPAEVWFRHQAPADTVLHRETFCCPVHFSGLLDMIRFESATLEWSLVHADTGLALLLDRYANEALARLPPPGEFKARVRRAIVDAACGSELTATAIARRLHMSVRTLQRNLRSEGSTLREIVEMVRRELASRYLAQPWLSLEEIAFLLGFADVSGFSRAFHRWTGTSVGRYRESLADSDSLRDPGNLVANHVGETMSGAGASGAPHMP